MAEIAGSLMSRLAYMLAQKTFQEASLVSSFRDDLDFMFKELGRIQCLLKDAHGATHSSSASNWLREFQDFFEDATDLIENMPQQHNSTIGLVGRKIRVWRVSRKIRVLKDQIRGIHESSKYLQYLKAPYMDVQPPSMLVNERSLSGVFVDDSPVGMDIEEIVDWLSTDDPRIIAVTGMGGLGKSLLLKLVFDSQKIKETFDHRIWVDVSQRFSVQQLLQHIASEIKLPEDKRQIHLSVNMLRDNIGSHLQGSRCLLVLDDVWDRRAKELICSQDFTVMISTRDKKVAQQMVPQRIHEMGYLSEDDSRKLFFMHAFRKDEIGSLPADLKEIAADIADKCSGLPLTLKTVARSMVNVSRNPNEWEPTLNRLKQFDTITDDVLPTLRLSFDALPHYLKPCFLFCSAYPEDTRMGCEYLVQVWIAEGFVNPDETQDPYELGRSYLKQLVDRCMIEFLPYNENDDMIKYCKMHDLLHELALLESQKQTKCLYQAGRSLKKFPVEKCQGLRRISLIKNDITTADKSIPSPGLRTLLLWNNSNLKSISRQLFSKLRHLRVLDVSQTSIRSLPRSIAKLTHLKLLNLSRTKIEKLPSWLSALTNLLFLDVSWCENLTALHSSVGEHQCMLHLNTEGCEKLEFLPVGVSKLVSLRKLGQVVFKKNASNALQLMGLKGLTLLQQLSIVFSGSQSLIKEIFGEMTQMRKLFLQNSDDHALLLLPQEMSSMRRLEILHLHNCVMPAWISKLQNLMVLVLKGDHSANYIPLRKVLNLQRLTLLQNSNCTQFPAEFGMPPSFPKLESLIIQDFSVLESFHSMEVDSMPKLKYFHLQNCSQLKELPRGLDKLESLQELKVIGIEACITDPRLQENGLYWNHFKQHNIKFSCE